MVCILKYVHQFSKCEAMLSHLVRRMYNVILQQQYLNPDGVLSVSKLIHKTKEQKF